MDEDYNEDEDDEDEDDKDEDEEDNEDDKDEEDEEAINARRSPYWPRYRYFMISHGYRLDTCRDVKKFYEDYWERRRRAPCRSAQDKRPTTASTV